MSIHVPENFYRQTITRAVTLTTGVNIYVSAHPTPDEGYVAISPASTNLREIVYYTAKGTDGNGTYITVTTANRGLGGTTAQTHSIGEPVRMNVSAETVQEISDALDQIVAGGAQNASTTVKGIVEEATDAEVTAGTSTGGTGAKLFVAPDKLLTYLGTFSTPFIRRVYVTADSPATWTKPANLKYIDVEVVAGGGNGANGTNAGSNSQGGGGGGAGGYSKKKILAASLGATETVTIGAATAASSFGSHCSATAGGNASGAGGGTGGIGSGGDINSSGQSGCSAQVGSAAQLYGGTGGASFFGGGARGGYGTGTAPTSQVYGGGGGGGAGGDGINGTGGTGAAGLVVVVEYYI